MIQLGDGTTSATSRNHGLFKLWSQYYHDSWATAGEKPVSMQLVQRDGLGECPDQIVDAVCVWTYGGVLKVRRVRGHRLIGVRTNKSLMNLAHGEKGGGWQGFHSLTS
jgi:hypothetical protein